MPTSPSQKQIEEWCESPVAEYFVAMLRKRVDVCYEQRAEALIPGDPIRTQEIRSFVLGEESAFDEIVAVITSKDLSQLEESDDGEQVGDSPVRRPRTGQAGKH